MVASRAPNGQQSAPIPAAGDLWRYAIDYWQRQLLFLDALRERADNTLEHERAGLPPLLDFKYETLLDARRFDRPANYALLIITEVGEVCSVDCVDPDKPPVVVIDPRAGHGPGIGGFKYDSEVGMALHEGHPVYFAIFFPEPMRGQALADVHHALRRFVEHLPRLVRTNLARIPRLSCRNASSANDDYGCVGISPDPSSQQESDLAALAQQRH